jgi:predicted O-methyltransferase YrrM
MNYKRLASEIENVLAGKEDKAFVEIFQKVQCMSSPRVYGIINACVNAMEDGEIYLEVGSYQGGSMIAALQGNQAKAIGVDSFAEFTKTNSLSITMGNFQTFGVADRITFHNMGYKEFFDWHTGPTFKVAVYYYDGQHDAKGELEGIEACWEFLQSGSLIIIDDTRYPEVRQAINQFVAKHPDLLECLFAILPDHEFDKHWWNGITVLRVV